MDVIAADTVLFGAVIVVVCLFGVIGALVASARRGPRGGGGLWFFRGESDSSPVHGPGTRSEDRHELDPPSE